MLKHWIYQLIVYTVNVYMEASVQGEFVYFKLQLTTKF